MYLSPIKIGLALAALLLVNSCSSLLKHDTITLSAQQSWVLLPFENYSNTPLANHRAEALTETQLRQRGLHDLVLYPNHEAAPLSLLLDDGKRVDQALKWARQHNIRYGVTGKIQEWHYKNGLEAEPAIGLSMKIIDLKNQQVLWSDSASRTGWGYANLTGTAEKTIAALLRQVRIQ